MVKHSTLRPMDILDTVAQIFLELYLTMDDGEIPVICRRVQGSAHIYGNRPSSIVKYSSKKICATVSRMSIGRKVECFTIRAQVWRAVTKGSVYSSAEVLGWSPFAKGSFFNH